MRSRSAEVLVFPWLRRRVRKWRRAWSARHYAGDLPATTGRAVFALCHPEGPTLSPPLLTVFRNGAFYSGCEDTEIRGFLDGEVKFERNVATQYHVRVGCEGSKPFRGRYEVMRLLQRWDVSAIPATARIHSVRLVLQQEDCSRFPHRYPLRWPSDFYVYPVLKPWGAGRGGISHDNQSRPERGDAWWLDARAGELPWREPGCGYGSDTDTEADRGAAPLSWSRLQGPCEELCFSGTGLARHVEHALKGKGTLDLLVKASASEEVLPGSVKAFFSGEFGDDLNPVSRPRLEVEWTTPCLSHIEEPFTLEPGTELLYTPGFSEQTEDPSRTVLVASIRIDDRRALDRIVPEVHAVDWKEASSSASEATPSEAGAGPSAPVLRPLELPLRGRPGPTFQLRISSAVNAVSAGDAIHVRLLETWAPDAATPDDLAVHFRFTAPSGRPFERRARHRGEYIYDVEFQPDELGVWEYRWRTRPDRRFEEHRGGGCFTVVPGITETSLSALQAMVDAAVHQSRRPKGILTRRRGHVRLTALQRDVRALLTREQIREPGGRTVGRLWEMLRAIAGALPNVE